ncbi:transglutaminase-like domain-containing protein [Aureibacter tunicatorum]|uniref:Regulator of sirC expression with transglutaminase-like and TPR domain n=1 Tax=Aureibacter tunicatorum TaxID=866807 RepID=A0AAE4BPT4_9BACT|nr:transglutaminase-like domain-containing protein [Aureibacter tunicatorum]MDR6238329.1 regulator of sirC expression with transglutaminase-like and TPR domain [Aureibacter tunicatorum]BDD03361.1 hypothetical protein AUTU_08440 [Aureibacter tunicatorum]
MIMNDEASNEFKALVSLLDDPDEEVSQIVEMKLIAMGLESIPLLEKEWEGSDSSLIQGKIEEIIDHLYFQSLKKDLLYWNEFESDDLLKGMWLVARFNHPELSYESLNASFSQLYHEAWAGFSTDLHPYDQVKRLNGFLFGLKKFKANNQEFHAVSNSMINEVLESKKGNPITLCVIYLLIAKKLGMPVFGVNLPNLFILLYRDDKYDFYINAFNKGLIFSKGDIEAYISQLKTEFKESYFSPCSNKQIVQRCLRNLITSYTKLGDEKYRDKASDLLKVLEAAP